jgi:hypothetical protein
MNSDWQSGGPDSRFGVVPEARPATLAGAGEGTAQTGTSRSASPWSALRSPRMAWSGGLLLVGIGLFSLYLRQSRIAPFNSDGASIMLQAQSMLHGNVLLSGWWTADVSFYTTELPEYMLVELFRGLRPDVVHIAGALTYTLIVLLGALLARGRVKGRAGIVRALLAGGIMLAPGIIGGTPVLLENPDHAGTAVPILLTLLILDRAPERWYVPVAVCGLLAWTQVADQLTLIAATAPIVAVAAFRLLMLAIRRRPLAEYRYDALLLVAAGLSFAVAKLADHAVRALGGFSLHPLPQQLLAPSSMFRSNARVMGQTLMLLFGANNPGPAHHLELIARFHLIGLALAVCGFAVALATFVSRRTDRVTQILVAATIATLAAGILGTELPSLDHAHEVAILLPLGAVLAGRVLPGLVPERWHPARVVVPVVAVWLACGLAALCYAASWAPLPPPDQALASWLAGHGYTDGLAAYWQANDTTVTSGGKVLVAPINAQATAVRPWEAWINWYEPNLRQADFVIAVSNPSATPGGGLSPARVRKHFGHPAHVYDVGPYVIMAYNYNLLTKLGGNKVFPGNVQPITGVSAIAAAAQAP